MLSKKRDGLGKLHPLNTALRLQLSPYTAREKKPRDCSQALLVPFLICHCDHQIQEEVEELLGMRAGGREWWWAFANEFQNVNSPQGAVIDGVEESGWWWMPKKDFTNVLEEAVLKD
jgi:hypothetical protein